MGVDGAAPEALGHTQAARGFLVPNPGGDPLRVDDAVIGARASGARAENEAALAAALRAVADDLPGWRARSDQITSWARRTLTPFAMSAEHAAVLRAAASRTRQG